MGSNTARGTDVCAYPVFVFLLTTGMSHIQGVLSTIFKIKVSELINSDLEHGSEPNSASSKKNKLTNVEWE
jgi:hypothetical protein